MSSQQADIALILRTSMKIFKQTVLTNRIGVKMAMIYNSLSKDTRMSSLGRAAASLALGIDDGVTPETRQKALEEGLRLCNNASDRSALRKMIKKANHELKKLHRADRVKKRRAMKMASIAGDGHDDDGAVEGKSKASEETGEEGSGRTSEAAREGEGEEAGDEQAEEGEDDEEEGGTERREDEGEDYEDRRDSDLETMDGVDQIDRTPVVKGKPEPAKLNIRIPHKDHPNNRSKDHVYRYNRSNEVDWNDHKWITTINRWRSQVFRRKTGVKQRTEGVPFETVERQWIIQKYKDEPKIGLAKLTKEFNAAFAGKTLQGCKKGPRPTRTESAISSECARNHEIRTSRGKPAVRMTERRREIRDLLAARKEKRLRAKQAAAEGEEED